MGAMFLYTVYNSRVYEFRNLVATSATTLKLMMGGITQWHKLYQFAPNAWTALVGVFFIVVVLFLDNLTLAILLSHKKEKDLEENASHHTFWGFEKTKAGNKDFNPAKVGYDF